MALPACGTPLAAPSASRYTLGPMKRIFDMDDRARLPWRFHGERLALLAAL